MAARWLVGAILLLAAALALGCPARAGEPPSGDGGGRRITISLADRRLYVTEPGVESRSFPVAIGRPGVAIQLGDSTVIRKRRNPTWRPTAEQRRAKPSLPSAVPPGPANPLGKFALDLGWTAIAIHGTNDPDSIGHQASAGCFRMMPADIETLFETTEIGTPVRVVRDSMDGAREAAVVAVAARPVAAKVIPAPRSQTRAPASPPPVAAVIPATVIPAAATVPALPPPAVLPPPAPLPDPRCPSATAPLRRLICDTPTLALLDGRARGLQERFLAGLPDRSAVAYAVLQDERRFDDRIAALCWVRRGTEGDPTVAGAARNCLSNALNNRLDEVVRRIAEAQGVTRVAGRP